MSDKIENVNKMSESISSKLTSFNIDKFIKKKGFIKKDSYISIYDAYRSYYTICIEIAPMISNLEKNQNQIKETLLNMEALDNNFDSEIIRLENKTKEIKDQITELQAQEVKSGEFSDKEFMLNVLEKQLLNISSEKEMLRQNGLQLILLKETNNQLLNIIDNLIGYSVPIWKKQVSRSITLMTEHNKRLMRKEYNKSNSTSVDSDVRKEIENIRKANIDFREGTKNSITK